MERDESHQKYKTRFQKRLVSGAIAKAYREKNSFPISISVEGGGFHTPRNLVVGI